MKSIKVTLAVCVALCSINAFAAKKKAVEKADTSFIFTDIKVNPTTSVKDQNITGTCWSFSGISFLEDELLRTGKGEYDLSEMYVVRHCYLDKAIKYIRYYGKTNFAEGGGTMDVPFVWKNYGIVPDSVYTGLQYGEDKHVHSELTRVLTAYLEEIAKNPNKKLSTKWFEGYKGILDAYLDKEPETFTYQGKT